MPSEHHDRSAEEPRELGRWERWTTDWDGEPIIEFDSEAHDEWCKKWAPRCPEGNLLQVRRALGFRERNTAELELRVALGGDDLGVCRVIVDERDDEVYVRVLIAYEYSEASGRGRVEYTDWPVRVWLERPLGDRAVIDVDSDEELPLYKPKYMNNVVQPDHGYHDVHRRRRIGRDSKSG